MPADSIGMDLKPIGDSVDSAPESVLHGQLSINGQASHVTAIQVVKNQDGSLSAVAKAYEEDLEHLYALSGAGLSTTQINWLDYVIFVIPHAS